MTVIVGIRTKDCVYIGADSLGSNGYNKTERKDSKVFFNGNFLIGFTNSFRMGQLLRYKLEIPKPSGDLFKFMVCDFVDAVRKCLKENGYMNIKNNEEIIGTFLVGYKNKLFCIHDDAQVEEALDEYNACGCGEDFALGSLFSTKNLISQPKKRIIKAIDAAKHFSPNVDGETIILSTKDIK